MKIYHYARDTNEFKRAGKARKDPLEKGRYLIPAFATDRKPPKTGENEVAVFDEENKSWEIVDDYRGQVFWDEERNKHIIKKLGQKPEENWSTEKPGPTDKEILEGELAENQKRLEDLYSAHNKLLARDADTKEVKKEIKSVIKYIRSVNDELSAL